MTTSNFLRHLWIAFLLFRCSEGSELGWERLVYDVIFQNYSSDVRPLSKFNSSKVMEVTIGTGLRQIESLNEKNEQLTSHMYLIIKWTDELLLWKPEDYNYVYFIIVPANKVWLPEITPINSVSGAIELASERDNARVRVYYDGTVLWIPGVKMNTACDVDVTKFPYDVQKCDILFANWMHTMHQLNYTVLSSQPDLQLYNPSQEWELISSILTAVVIQDKHDLSLMYPTVNLSIVLRRNPTFFEFNLMLPSMIMSFLLITVFVLPVDSGEKVSLGVTMLLAYSILMLMLTDITPRSGSIPQLSMCIFICIIASGVSVVLSVIVINVYHHCPDKPVPGWVKRLMLGTVGNVVYCRKKAASVADLEQKPESDENLGRFKKKAFEDILENSNFACEWQRLARLLDRIFFWIFTIFFFLNLSYLMILKFRS